jgi:hypothetical protein
MKIDNRGSTLRPFHNKRSRVSCLEVATIRLETACPQTDRSARVPLRRAA